MAYECTENNKCGTCSGAHMMNGCAEQTKKWCVSCNSNNHSSWDRDCPTLAKKIEEFNQRNPENSLPFFLTAEPWTWAPIPNATTRKPSQRAEELKRKTDVPIAHKSGFQTQINLNRSSATNNHNSGARNNRAMSQSRMTPRENNESQPQNQGNTRRGTPAPSSTPNQSGQGQSHPPGEQTSNKNAQKVNIANNNA